MPSDPAPGPAQSQFAAAVADRYRLEREIGAGGMATVYLAEDIKHRRKVAVKVLLPEVAAVLGPDRFLREIAVAARLQHPHILPLHDSGEADGFLYYVMPYVEGESLRQRLAAKGEFPVADTLRILAEVADALAYAHAAGVVHRDMKPDNIMISGRHPVVMDFGIAKAVSIASEDKPVTTASIALGTPAYMAPEQATADPLTDHRADIYALGVIGYEMLTGSPPFTGMPAAQIMAAHVTLAPEPISELRPGVPPALAMLMMRCLEKRPADRPQSAEELVHAIVALGTPSGGLTPAGSRPWPRARARVYAKRVAIAVLTVAAAATVGAVLWPGGGGPSVAPPVRHTQISFSGMATMGEISPDGQMVAFVEQSEGGQKDSLVVKDLAGGSVLPIMTAPWRGFVEQRWSPDGASILFLLQDSARGIESGMVPRLGGAPRQLPDTLFPVMSPDGTRLASWSRVTGSPIRITTLKTGDVREIAVPESIGWHATVLWAPNGRSIAVQGGANVGMRFAVVGADVETGVWRPLFSDSGGMSRIAWAAATNSIYFVRRNTELRALRMGADGAPRGAPVTLQTGIGPTGFNLSINADGNALVYSRAERRSNIWSARLLGRRIQSLPTQLTFGTANAWGGRLSPDGKWIAFVRSEEHIADIYIMPASGGAPRRLSSRSGTSANPVWSPDGTQLAFLAAHDGTPLMRTVMIATGKERDYPHARIGAGGMACAPLRRILYSGFGDRGFRWLDPSTEAEEAFASGDTSRTMWWPTPSPDGKLLAYFGSEPDGEEAVYVIAEGESTRHRVGRGLPPGNTIAPRGWSADGRFVFLQTEKPPGISRAPIDGGPPVRAAPEPLNGGTCDVQEDKIGILLLCTVFSDRTTDIWMMENFDPAAKPAKARDATH